MHPTRIKFIVQWTKVNFNQCCNHQYSDSMTLCNSAAAAGTFSSLHLKKEKYQISEKLLYKIHDDRKLPK
jgi:hypothetical protein